MSGGRVFLLLLCFTTPSPLYKLYNWFSCWVFVKIPPIFPTWCFTDPRCHYFMNIYSGPKCLASITFKRVQALWEMKMLNAVIQKDNKINQLPWTYRSQQEHFEETWIIQIRIPSDYKHFLKTDVENLSQLEINCFCKCCIYFWKCIFYKSNIVLFFIILSWMSLYGGMGWERNKLLLWFI